MGKRFNRYVKNFARYQNRLESFQANPLNPTTLTGERDLITGSEGPVLVDCEVIVNADGLSVDIASDSERLYTDFEYLVPIAIEDVLGFTSDFDTQRDGGSPEKDRHLFWEDESQWNDVVRTVYPGWRLKFGMAYRFQGAVLKANDELCALIAANASQRFDRAMGYDACEDDD